MHSIFCCDFCDRTDKDEEIMALHEKKCVYNPAVKTCQTCVHQKEINFIKNVSFICMNTKSSLYYQCDTQIERLTNKPCEFWQDWKLLDEEVNSKKERTHV